MGCILSVLFKENRLGKIALSSYFHLASLSLNFTGGHVALHYPIKWILNGVARGPGISPLGIPMSAVRIAKYRCQYFSLCYSLTFRDWETEKQDIIKMKKKGAGSTLQST